GHPGSWRCVRRLPDRDLGDHHRHLPFHPEPPQPRSADRKPTGVGERRDERGTDPIEARRPRPCCVRPIACVLGPRRSGRPPEDTHLPPPPSLPPPDPETAPPIAPAGAAPQKPGPDPKPP